MLEQEVSSFLSFFKMDRLLIDKIYSKNYSELGWNWDYDGKIMDQSYLAKQSFQNVDDFFKYIQQLRSHTIDFYPTFLRIIDMINLPELDRQLEKIFIGKPVYGCSN